MPVVGESTVLDLTLSLDTSQYASGDVLAATQELANAARVPGGIVYLQNVHVLDEDDQGAAFDLLFLDANVGIGTENDAANITDANARNVVGTVQVTSYIDLVNSQVSYVDGGGQMMKAASGTKSLYVAAVSRGTGTYTASGIKLKLGIMQD